MQQQTHIFSYGDLTIEYIHIQKNENSSAPVLLCFHGFGRGMEDFLEFKSFAFENQTMISFNLFHHGKSELVSDRIWRSALTKTELKEFFEQLFAHLKIEKIEILGYSMGGKLGFFLTELFPTKVKRLTLIAPDGLKITGIYKFASRTKIGIGVFRHVIEKPKAFFGFVKTLNKIGLISNGQRRVMLINMETRKKRKQVGEAWFVFSKIDPDVETIRQNIKANNIITLMLYGKFDKIIPAKQGKKFIKGIDSAEIIIASQGHAMMNYKIVDKLVDAKKRPR